MYEEDRQHALELYGSIFDEVGNENAILQLFVSPTRQAVNLARSYDAKERKQQMAAGYLAEEPAFVQTIEALREQAEAMGLSVAHVDDNQFSLFDEPDAAEAVFQDLSFPHPSDTEEFDSLSLDLPVNESLFPDEDPSADPLPPAPEPIPVPAQEPVEEPAREAPVSSDAVDHFLADFNIPDEDEAQNNGAREARASAEPLPVYQPDSRDEDGPAPVKKTETAYPGEKSARSSGVFIPELVPRTKKKPRVALLILFVLLAIPVTLAGICLLLIPAVLLLAAAAAALPAGVWGLGLAFTGFSVFADILVVFGLSLAAAALGLLFLWLFIRLLFGAVPGLIRGVCALGGRWCYKEVEA